MGIVNVRKQDKYLCGPEAEQDLRTVKETEAPAPLGSIIKELKTKSSCSVLHQTAVTLESSHWNYD